MRTGTLIMIALLLIMIVAALIIQLSTASV